jgi:predicted outer membrane repeat protein
VAGLYDDTPGLSDGTGLWRGRLGLFSGASGLINGSGGAYIDLYFSAGTYSVAGNGYSTLTSVAGFTFTRASLAMGYDATGKLTYGPNNLLLQSQTFGTTWTATQVTVGSNVIAAPDGTMTADSLIATAVSSQHRADQTPSSPAGPQVFSVYAKAGAYNYVGLRIGTVGAGFDLTTGATSSVTGGITATATSVGNGWWRCAIHYATAAANDICRANIADGSSFAPTFTGDGVSAGIYLWGAQLEAVTYQTTPSTYYPTTTAAYYGPRLVYDPVTLASLGILVEEARTNINVQSNTLTNAAWAISAATIGGTPIVAPDGSTTASVMDDGVTTAEHFITIASPPATTASTNYTYSIFVKNGTRRYVGLSLGRLGSSGVYVAAKFDLVAGTYVTTTAGGGTLASADIRAVGNDWWRISVCGQLGAVTDLYGIFWMGNDATTFGGSRGRQSYTGTSATVYPWGAQLELGQGASSPIPTTTAAVTRAADAVSVTGISVPNPHSMAAEWTPGFDNGSSFRRAASLTNAGFSATDDIYQRFTNNFVRMFSSDMDLTLGTGNATTGNKASARFELNNSAGSLNGGAIASDTSSTPATPIDRLYVGATSSSNWMNGTISRIRIYNRALTDAQLQNLTQSLLLQEDGYSILQEDNSYIWLE